MTTLTKLQKPGIKGHSMPNVLVLSIRKSQETGFHGSIENTCPRRKPSNRMLLPFHLKPEILLFFILKGKFYFEGERLFLCSVLKREGSGLRRFHCALLLGHGKNSYLSYWQIS